MEFVKPIESPIAEAIMAWEKARPFQPPVADSKRCSTTCLATEATRWEPTVCNNVGMPLLLRKAGLPKNDSRRPITSHRVRATLATRLYNARSGLTPVEIINCLGHADFSSTQHYLRLRRRH